MKEHVRLSITFVILSSFLSKDILCLSAFNQMTSLQAETYLQILEIAIGSIIWKYKWAEMVKIGVSTWSALWDRAKSYIVQEIISLHFPLLS